MNFHRIFAIFLRHLYLMRRSYDKMIDTFYWVLLDLMLWGITAAYFQEFSNNTQQIIFAIITAVILWNVTYRSQSEISFNILEELWNKNLVNIFVSPLTFANWIYSLILLALFKCLISVTFASVAAYLIYKVTVFSFSWYLVPVFVLLIMSGLWLGFFVSGLILRFGTKVQALSWTLIWVIGPFSAMYFPMSILPPWAQFISRLLPTSYIFEFSRQLIYTGEANQSYLWMSLLLNIIYISVSIFFLRRSFQKVLEKGLVKVY